MNFKLEIAQELSKVIKMDLNELYDYVEIPAKSSMGDFAFPCFRLAKLYQKSPAEIALSLSEKISPNEIISEVKAVSGYINFYIHKEALVRAVISEVQEKGQCYGQSDMGKDKTIVIDYSSPNVAKPFHVGHLRTTVIGNALYNIHQFLGYTVIGVNHLGDWGTQFGKLITAYKHWGNEEEINKNGIKELVNIYVRFHKEANENEAMNDEARAWLLKMQEGDQEALKLWRWFNEVSMKEFTAIYKRLDIEFDYYTGESFYNDKMDAVVEELQQKNLLVESDGAQVVDLSEFNMPPCLILRSDGGTLYPTRDVAAAEFRYETYHFHKSLYVTGLEQNLHFAQWFKVIELLGYTWARDLVHIPYGLVSLETGKLSTRDGNVIYMEDLLNEAVNRTKNIIEEKNPELEDKEKIAEAVGIGAIIFNDLYNGRIKDVTFSWDRMLNFDGETGPYVQYTHARCCSVLKKAGDVNFSSIDYALLTDPESIEVLKLIDHYPEKIIEAAEKYEPFVITRHLVDIAQAFNRFYHDHSILNAEAETKKARLALVDAVRLLLSGGLKMIGIKSPDKM